MNQNTRYQRLMWLPKHVLWNGEHVVTKEMEILSGENWQWLFEKLKNKI